jgi:hypothetical protein
MQVRGQQGINDCSPVKDPLPGHAAFLLDLAYSRTPAEESTKSYSDPETGVFLRAERADERQR